MDLHGETMTAAIDAPPRAAGKVWRAPAATWLLVAAVGLAFADASIVVLALPPIYGEYETTIVGVSWVLTGYAAVVAVVALLVAVIGPRVRPVALAGGGLIVFAAASVACGLANSLAALMVGRCVQGAGAALLLAGSLAVLRATLGQEAGSTAWSTAAAVGLVVGPALGGVLTEMFDWRSIFLFQAPLGLLALTAVAVPAARTAQPSRRGGARRPPLLPNLGLILLSGALVGALFLSVLLVIEIWRYSPVAGAGVVTALPAAMLLVRYASVRLPAVAHSLAGALLLGGGLSALAWLPSTDIAWMVAALALCGAGVGLLTGALDRLALGDGRDTVRNGALAVSARHAGLVLGLVLIAPILAGTLDQASERAALAGASVVLDARAPVQDKVKIALTMRDQLDASQRGAVPDLEKSVAVAGVESASGLRVGEQLAARVKGVLTRAFRPAFGAAACLGLAVAIPGLAMLARNRRRPREVAAANSRSWVGRGAPATTAAFAGLSALILCGGGLLVAEQSAGAAGFGSYREANACAAEADPYPGGGLDAGIQRIALSAVNGAACELGISRERLVLSLDGQQRFGGPRLDRQTMERALRAGLVRSVEDAEQRDDLPGWILGPLKSLVETAPLSWFLDQLGLPAR